MRIEMIQLILALSVEENLHIQMDVIAYIKIYMKQSPMFEIVSRIQKICKLLRSL